ncbi:MAG: SpoIVB peptidase [Thermoanaerobacterales bacterium]|nr:SpoIVB peptidase [Thermoanaerobacterales bacterium]
MSRSFLKRLGFIFFAFLVAAACCTPAGRSFFGAPAHRQVLVGESLSSFLNVPPPLLRNLDFHTDHPELLEPSPSGTGPLVRNPGELQVSLRLFGVIPLRYLTVTAVPEVEVVPGGQAIGVLLHSQGVLVVGQAPIRDAKGREHSPAREAGIAPGDLLLKINGRQVISESDVRELVNKAGRGGRSLKLELRRQKRTFQARVTPIYCGETAHWRIGLLVRDSAAGVGTLTFYEPHTRSYGALGHVIADAQTSQAIELADGKIVAAVIEGVRPGRRGQPGEKLGVFAGEGDIAGTIQKNTTCGIFGMLRSLPSVSFYRRPIPVALAEQIRPGKAEILTVLDENRVERFEIEIERVRPGARKDGKGLVIRVTDPKLLERTGGIIQGMSGSPIIQDGRLVGAVTHVFINNPTRGYGVPVEWMVEECGLRRSDIVRNEMNDRVKHRFAVENVPEVA